MTFTYFVISHNYLEITFYREIHIKAVIFSLLQELTIDLSNIEIKYIDIIEDCPICSEHSCDLLTSCNHSFCESCIQTWINMNNHTTCPTCRNVLTNTMFQSIQLKQTNKT